MRKFVAASAVAVLMSAAGIGLAQAKGPDPSGPAHHGLCTAYFSGSENGQAHKHQATPFQNLEQAADEAGDGNGTATRDEVLQFCDGAIGGRAGR